MAFRPALCRVRLIGMPPFFRHSCTALFTPYCAAPYTPKPLQVLAELAEYRPPTAATTGQYSLKAERWREFDPFYPHYTP